MGKYKHKSWPAWYYNPQNGQGMIFEHEQQVPSGWSDDPNVARDSKAKTSALKAGEGYIPRGESGAAPLAMGSTDTSAAGSAPGTAPVVGTGGEAGDSGSNTGQGGPGVGTPPVINQEELTSTGSTAEPLPAMSKVGKDWIVRQLQARSVQFNKGWNETKLYNLLKDNWQQPKTSAGGE